MPNFPNASPEALLKDLELQWQDHFQTRTQTWKTLEITALLAVALFGLSSQVNNPSITLAAAFLLVLISLFGTQITLRHRNKVEYDKMAKISKLERDLHISNNDPVVERITSLTVFNLKKSNTSLFILRIHFVIQLFALIYIGLHLFS